MNRQYLPGLPPGIRLPLSSMFILFGVRTILRDVKGGIALREHCSRCGLVSDFRHQRERRFVTLYLVPVIPISKAESIITCNRCGASYDTNHRGFQPGVGADTDPGKTLLVCPGCSGKMRIPLKLDNAIQVTCPHCQDQFTVSVNRS